MDMPTQVLCEKCGARANVINEPPDQIALAGKMPANDIRWQEGFFFSINCPNCGTRMQCLAPPP
jgi:predicted nucleic-acid-binding Zn-ribbon protein